MTPISAFQTHRTNLAFICLSVVFVGCSSPSVRDRPGQANAIGRHIPKSSQMRIADGEAEIDANKKRRSLMFTQARLKETDGKIEEALKIYQELLELNPGHSKALHRAAVVQTQLGEFEKAEANFQAALADEAATAQVHADFGYFCYLTNRSELAEQHLRKAIESDPSIKEAHTNLGLSLARSGDLDAARSHFLKAGCSESQILSNLALARLFEGDLEGAREYYQHALELSPDDDDAARGLEVVERIEWNTGDGVRRPEVAEAALTEAAALPGRVDPVSAAFPADFKSSGRP